MRGMHAARCLTMDDSGWAWVGSETGNVKAVQLALQKQPHGGLCKTLEVRPVPAWHMMATTPPPWNVHAVLGMWQWVLV